jgi:hypothetical protein
MLPRLYRLPEDLMVHLHTAYNKRKKHTHLNRLNPKYQQKYHYRVDDIVLYCLYRVDLCQFVVPC